MHQITVRRYQADEARSHNDFVLKGDDAKRVGGNLEDTLRTAQEERGRGLWSDADPEVWFGTTLVGHLEPGGDVAQLARRVMEVCRNVFERFQSRRRLPSMRSRNRNMLMKSR